MADALRISVDGMGGDYAPQNVVAGCVQAVSEFDIRVVLTGVESKLKTELRKHTFPASRIDVVDAPEVIAMSDPAATAVRRKRNSSMRVAIDLAASGAAQAILSAGNTGAMYTTVKIAVGSLPGVDRLPLAALFPHPNGKSIVLDVGANIDCKAHQLLEFALMGVVYAEEILGIERPRIGLLSIGEEEAKGNDLTREVFAMIKQTDLNFIGNMDGYDIFKGKADVVVCDGFTGNVALKVSESLIETVFHLLQSEIEEHPKIAATLTKYFDYSEYGGAPLLGARIPSFVCHGRSSAKAIKNALRVAMEFCRNNVNERIERRLSNIIN